MKACTTTSRRCSHIDRTKTWVRSPYLHTRGDVFLSYSGLFFFFFSQMLSSPSPSSSGQLSQLGASLYGPQSKFFFFYPAVTLCSFLICSTVWVNQGVAFNLHENKCKFLILSMYYTVLPQSKEYSPSCLMPFVFPAWLSAGALGFSVRGMGNNTPQLNRNLTQGTQLPSHITPTTGVPTMSLHTPPSPSRYV